MFLFGIALLVVASAQAVPATPAGEGKHWAVLVAGSNGWYNYRHQADVCHAYQILHNHGIPDEQIIVMMYDDIAHNKENPTPGIIINRPNGHDVYKGVPKDYTGEDVTPKNFLDILQGKPMNVGSGKTLKSGPDDHVFIYFTDHGAPGLVAFPEDELHAKELNAVLKKMHREKKYKQLVFYMEACESGSMFYKLLPRDINIYATTAANRHESSYAVYFDKKRKTYLGDVYSVKWMEDSDKEELTKESLKKQYAIVKKETNTSHVQEFGDLSIAKETVSQFQGRAQGPPSPYSASDSKLLDAVKSEDVPLAILEQKLRSAGSFEERNAILKQLQALLQSREKVRQTVKNIVAMASTDAVQAQRVLEKRHELSRFDCYRPMVEFFDAKCFDINTNDYALRHLYTLVNLCEEGVLPLNILNAMSKVC